MISQSKLRLLVELFRQGTLRAAAEALSYSPSAASWQLAQLEREVGVSLVARSGQRLVLTEAGEWLARQGSHVLAQLDALEHQASHYVEKPVGTIRLSVFPSAGYHLVIPMLKILRERHPEIEVSVVEREPIFAHSDLKHRKTDVALIYDYSIVPLPLDDEIAYKLIACEKVLLAMSASDALAIAHDQIPIAALRDYVWLADERGGLDEILAERLCAGAGFIPIQRHAIRDYKMTIGMIAAGFGISLIPEMLVRQPAEGALFRPFADISITRRILLAHLSGTENRPILVTLSEVLQEVARTSVDSDRGASHSA